MNMSEILFLGILGLVFLGPKKLAQLAPRAGKALAHLRRATSEFKLQLAEELESHDGRDPNIVPAESVLISDNKAVDSSTEAAIADHAL